MGVRTAAPPAVGMIDADQPCLGVGCMRVYNRCALCIGGVCACVRARELFLLSYLTCLPENKAYGIKYVQKKKTRIGMKIFFFGKINRNRDNNIQTIT